MDKKSLRGVVKKIEDEGKIFSKKSLLDTLSYTDEPIGRELQTEQLIRHLVKYKEGHVETLVSVYGRSGSGKSTITRQVCENLDGISYCIVNLRETKTSFGATNLILGELDEIGVKNSQGINVSISKIEEAIVSKLKKEQKNFFVLVLDEFDAIFYNKKEKPSDFIYKLLVIEEHLREKGLLMTMICISNNVIAQYELDDRVKSRIGSADVFFEPYSKKDIIGMLEDRIKNAISVQVDKSIIEYCAEISAIGHGDARRAIDLFRTAVEMAAKKKETLSQIHVDKADQTLKTSRIALIVKTASPQFKIVCFCLSRISYLMDEAWHATSVIYKQYKRLFPNDPKPLGYRRVSELLVEIENTGIAESHRSSAGRYGFGKSYRFAMPPELLGRLISKEMWKEIEENKAKHVAHIEKSTRGRIPSNDYFAWERNSEKMGWKNYVGV